MTMLSLRVSEDDAETLREWSERLGLDRSEIIRTAIRKHIALLAAEDDSAAWEGQPLTEHEASLGDVASWGPAEDWSDWADAAR